MAAAANTASVHGASPSVASPRVPIDDFTKPVSIEQYHACLLAAARVAWPGLAKQPDWQVEAALLLGSVEADIQVPPQALLQCLKRHSNTPAQLNIQQMLRALAGVPSVFTAGPAGVAMVNSATRRVALGRAYGVVERDRWIRNATAMSTQSVFTSIALDGAGYVRGSAEHHAAQSLAFYLAHQPDLKANTANVWQSLQQISSFWIHSLYDKFKSWKDVKEMVTKLDSVFTLTLEGPNNSTLMVGLRDDALPKQMKRAPLSAAGYILPAALRCSVDLPTMTALPGPAGNLSSPSSSGVLPTVASQPSAPPRLPTSAMPTSAMSSSAAKAEGGNSSSTITKTIAASTSRTSNCWMPLTCVMELNDRLQAVFTALGAAEAAAEAARRSGAARQLGSIAGADQQDQDVASMMSLLPDSLWPHLEPYTQQPSDGGGGPRMPEQLLVEVVVDEGRDVELRMAQRGVTKVLEGVQVSVSEAVATLARATGQTAEPSLGMLQDTASSSSSSSSEASMNGGAAAAGGTSAIQPATASTAAAAVVIDPFGSDNRCCVPHSLHRISAMRDRGGRAYGLTYRVGRHTPGAARLVGDLLAGLASGEHRVVAAPGATLGEPSMLQPLETPGSLLLVGKPGSGKTTLLRDVARLLADDLNLKVVVVDTSNEIAGDYRTPHECIGRARRMMVPQREQLWAKMLEAVQNHAPDAVVVDEIGSDEEVAAARTISQRGVMLIATAHGTSLKTVLRNPTLDPLLGGIRKVTVGDATARESNSGSKTRLERHDAPTFTALVEMREGGSLVVHPDAAESVDILLSSLNASTTGGIRAAAAAAEPPSPPHARPLSSTAAAVTAGLPAQLLAAHQEGLAAAGPRANHVATGAAAGAAGAAAPQQPVPHSQLRYWDGAGRMVVEFRTAEAAARAGVLVV